MRSVSASGRGVEKELDELVAAPRQCGYGGVETVRDIHCEQTSWCRLDIRCVWSCDALVGHAQLKQLQTERLDVLLSVSVLPA